MYEMLLNWILLEHEVKIFFLSIVVEWKEVHFISCTCFSTKKKKKDFFPREVYSNNNLYCCKTLQYHLIRGNSEQADKVVSDAESIEETAYEHRCKYNLSHHHLC